MKITRLVVAAAVTVGGLSYFRAPAVEAARGTGAARGERTYDPKTVATLRGPVTAITVVPAPGGSAGGTHVTLEAGDRTVDVHLGPTWFLQREGFELAKGDSIEATGSLIHADGDTFLVAREVRKGDKVLKLRDERGVPVWSGRGRP